jgi:GNAT superfamily N-acetyltransferase
LNHSPHATTAAALSAARRLSTSIFSDRQRRTRAVIWRRRSPWSCPDGVIGGFYTLSSAALRLHDLPEDIAKRLPRYPLIPATLIGRLAIDRRHHGQGWGSFLLLDARHRCTRSQVASFAVIVDAIDDDARAFYVHESFLPLPIHRAGCSGA